MTSSEEAAYYQAKFILESNHILTDEEFKIESSQASGCLYWKVTKEHWERYKKEKGFEDE